MPNPSDPDLAAERASAWSSLNHPVFRMLWFSSLTANVCMWMNDVTAAWLMTSLTTAPIMVALVQSASTLPMFLLGIPSGALADIIDRRRYFIATQFWVAAVAVLLSITAFTGTLNAPLLLVLTLANGVGLAMRLPVAAALVADVLPRHELSGALALNAIAMNTSRIIGPIIAGAVIAAFGIVYVFLLNAVLSVVTGAALLRWRRSQKVSALPSERFFGAIRVGVQYVRQSPVMHAVLLRTALFALFSTALLALLPLVAKGLPGGDARTYTLLLAGLGVGAVTAGFFLPRLRKFMTRDQLVRNGTLVVSVATLGIAYAPNAYLAFPLMLIAGMAWISVGNALHVAAQMGLPDWVRARGMSMYQTAMMGGTALGAALWGQVATVADVPTSLVVAAITSAGATLFTRRFTVGGRADEDLTPARLWKEPEVAIPIEHDQGPVLVTIEYRINVERAAEFAELMLESRSSRLRNGAIAWELFHDTAEPGRYLEYYVDESWVQHLRRYERMTAWDNELSERKKAFHIGDTPPLISRYIAEPVAHG